MIDLHLIRIMIIMISATLNSAIFPCLLLLLQQKAFAHGTNSLFLAAHDSVIVDGGTIDYLILLLRGAHNSCILGCMMVASARRVLVIRSFGNGGNRASIA